MKSMVAAVILAGALSAAATQLHGGGRILFEAQSRAAFGAAYSERAVKATIHSGEETTVTIRTGHKPRTLFVNGQRQGRRAWRYDPDTKAVQLQLGAGNTDLQLRFDRVRSLKPRQARIPLVHCNSEWKPLRRLGHLPVECRAEKIQGSTGWPAVPGVYRLRPKLRKGATDGTVSLGTINGVLLDQDEHSARYYLGKDSAISVSGLAPGFEVPLERIDLQLDAMIADAHHVPRESLDWEAAILVEGEAFHAEGGGTAKRSSEHGNTHGGACIFSWADPGHWISWRFPVKQAGTYSLVIVGASAESTVLRHLQLNGRNVPGAELISLPGTGGWGRSNAAEWQAFQLMLPGNEPLRFSLAAGEHDLTLNNIAGHHFNVDCLLLVPHP